MDRRYAGKLFRKILVPIIHGVDYVSALNAALAIGGRDNVLLIGIVPISSDES